MVALNQWDIVKERGIDIEVDKLSELLGVPIVTTVAPTGDGVEKLKEVVVKAAKGKEKRRKVVLGYGDDIEALIKKVENEISKDTSLSSKYPLRWLAIKVLEKDDEVLKMIEDSPYRDKIMEMVR